MQTFTFSKAREIADAVRAQQAPGARFIAGGTTLFDLMKLDVERPSAIIDINGLPLDRVETLPEGGLKIGALVRNADLAHHPVVARDYAALSAALLSGASAQLRNMATTGGNLLQRTRCVYFRNDAIPACNKRSPGSGCAAIGGDNRTLAILGTSDACIATNPSDMNVALTALEAVVNVEGKSGSRDIAITDFFFLPGDTPDRENVLEPGDLVTSITLPPPVRGANQIYLKLRDRASYEFALASAAVVATVADGKISYLRIALGGIATKPWRALEAERALLGATVDAAKFRAAAEAELASAKPQSENAFKIELAKRCLVSALRSATANG